LEEWKTEVRRQETGEKHQEANSVSPSAFAVFQPIIPTFHYSSIPLGSDMLNYNHYDVIIIGGGPAGMAVAVGASSAGLKRVLLLERHPKLGGILNQCIHVGFGLRYFKEELTGTEYAARYKKLFQQAGVEVKTSSFVHKISDRKQVTFVCPEGELFVSADHIVLATGCRERTREMLTIPTRLPVFPAGLAQEMVNIHPPSGRTW
jgi:NADPH-dependent 2,4-dienoyl-CoA reductase/sulfur reductase-like enzyme